VWGEARGSVDRGLTRRCSDGEGRRVGIEGVASCSVEVADTLSAKSVHGD
jgi:hypothetical protein